MDESANKPGNNGGIGKEEGRESSTEGESSAEEDREKEERRVYEPLDVAHILRVERTCDSNQAHIQRVVQERVQTYPDFTRERTLV